ncbi:MAG: insulinase family protein, partial [Pseudomonadales bacterium]|nr:insulinase family protein [Pseudomonadales bacterium]
EDIMAAELDELLALPAQLLDYKHTLAYTGSLPLEDVVSILREHYPVAEELADTPPVRLRRAREIDSNEVLVVDQQTAQAQVRIEFADGVYNEADTVNAQLYTSYFGSGMSSVVFQELREARALAYSASAAYSQGNREDAQNMMLGVIGTQTDKTVDALTAFIDLIDNMPASSERFAETANSLENRYRTSRVSFREVIGSVRRWEQLDLDGDPRRQRFSQLQAASLDDMIEFQQQHVAERPKLISVLGDLSVIDQEALASFGEVQEIDSESLFVD